MHLLQVFLETTGGLSTNWLQADEKFKSNISEHREIKDKTLMCCMNVHMP